MAKRSQRKVAKPGRPPGSPNKEYAPVEEIPPACVKCGSTNLVRVPGSEVIDRNIAGTLRHGTVYERITWTRKRCECGKLLVVRAYYSMPAAESPREN